jgi:hypothetical protein
MAFHHRAYDIFLDWAGIIGQPQLLADYIQAIQEEDTTHYFPQSSEFTKQKRKINYKRDKVYRSMKRIVFSHLDCYDPVISRKARHLYALLMHFRHIPMLNYDAKTEAIFLLIEELRSENYYADAEALGIVGWLNQLEELNVLFQHYVDCTFKEKQRKSAIPPKIASRITNIILRKILDYIRSLIALNTPQKYSSLVTEINLLIKHHNILVREHYGRLHAKTDISNMNVETIAEQIYTGKPINVIPVLSTRKNVANGEMQTEELVFTRDFTVKYRNNVEPGAATILVQGAGKYEGNRELLFLIE